MPPRRRHIQLSINAKILSHTPLSCSVIAHQSKEATNSAFFSNIIITSKLKPQDVACGYVSFSDLRNFSSYG